MNNFMQQIPKCQMGSSAVAENKSASAFLIPANSPTHSTSLPSHAQQE